MELVYKSGSDNKYTSLYDPGCDLADLTKMIAESELKIEEVSVNEDVELEQQLVSGNYSLTEFIGNFNNLTTSPMAKDGTTIQFIGNYGGERFIITTNTKENAVVLFTTQKPDIDLNNIIQKKSEGMKM